MQPFDPTGLYGAQQVLDVLRGKYGGRQVDFRYELLTAQNVKKADLTGMYSGSVSHDASADIKRTAQFTIRDGVDGIDYLSDRIKPWYRVRMPDGGWVEWAQGVFLLASPTRTLAVDGSVVRSVEAYDQTVVLSQDATIDRYSIPATTLFTDAIRGIVAGSIPTLNITPSTLRLPVTWDYEAGTPKLTIVNDLLSAMNYRSVWFDENGVMVCEPYILPDQRTSSLTYATDADSVFMGSIDQTVDLFDVPNRWTLVVSDTDQGSFSSTVTNINPASPTSVPARGRTISTLMDGQAAADQATLDALAAKTAYEASQVYSTLGYGTAVLPFHQNADILTLTIAGLGVSGVKVEELSWGFDLSVGASMSHSVRQVLPV